MSVELFLDSLGFDTGLSLVCGYYNFRKNSPTHIVKKKNEMFTGTIYYVSLCGRHTEGLPTSFKNSDNRLCKKCEKILKNKEIEELQDE